MASPVKIDRKTHLLRETDRTERRPAPDSVQEWSPRAVGRHALQPEQPEPIGERYPDRQHREEEERNRPDSVAVTLT